MTRTGMGPCQGRWCESTVRRVLAAAHGVPLAEPGRFTTRFPVRPGTVGDLAATAETL